MAIGGYITRGIGGGGTIEHFVLRGLTSSDVISVKHTIISIVDGVQAIATSIDGITTPTNNVDGVFAIAAEVDQR